MNELLLNLGPPNMLMKKRAFTLTFNFMRIHDCSISICFSWFREKLFFIWKKYNIYNTNKIAHNVYKSDSR